MPDTFSRESLAICVDKSIKGEQVCEELEKIKAASKYYARLNFARLYQYKNIVYRLYV